MYECSFMELLEKIWGDNNQSNKGYYYVVDAVEMAQKIYERPVKVTKDIYPVIARNINQRRLM